MGKPQSFHRPAQSYDAASGAPKLDSGFGVPRSFRAGASGHRGGGLLFPRSFEPPEKWHGEIDPDAGLPKPHRFRVIRQNPGDDYAHVVTPEEVRQKLETLPESIRTRVESELKLVSLSSITRKKSYFPCYGLQWGSAVYLYPLETPSENGQFTEVFTRPPRTSVIVEVKRFGAVVSERTKEGTWLVIWPPGTAKDFYLNNILIHEIGHLLDDKNTGYLARERFAEHFAIQYGTPSPPKNAHTRRRHHKHYF